MEVAKEDRDWQQEKVHWVSDIMAYQFDKFAQEHPGDQDREADHSHLLIPL